MINVMDNRNINKESEDIDILEIIKRLWIKRKFIIKVTVVFMLLGFFIAIFSPVRYAASSTIVPQRGDSKGAGSLGGIASMLGIQMGGYEGLSGDVSPMVYDKVIYNVELLKELLYTPVYFTKHKKKITFFDYYTKEEYKKTSVLGFVKKYIIGLPSMIIEAIRGKKDFPNFNELTDVNAFTKDEYEVVKGLYGSYSIVTDPEKGTIKIRAELGDPVAVAEMAQALTDLLQKYVVKFKIQSAVNNYDYIKGRYNEVKEEYDKVQQEYARFLDANKVLSTASARIREQQLSSKNSIVNAQFTELTAQLLQAELKIKQDTPTFIIIRPVQVPLVRSAPRRTIILFVFTLLGGVVACGAVLGLDYLKERGVKLKFLDKWE